MAGDGISRSPSEDVEPGRVPLLPLFESESQYEAMLSRLEPWLPAIREVCRRAGIAPMSALRGGLSETFPTAVIPPRHVLKLFGPWFDGSASFEAELRAYTLMAADPDLPVPRTVAHGALDADWSYLVTSFAPGIPLAQARRELAHEDMLRVATWLGRFVSRLQALPLRPQDRARAWLRWQQDTTSRYLNAPAVLAGWGSLPQWVVQEVATWLPPLEVLLPSDDWAVLLHADLHDEHVLGEMVDGHFEPHWVIDFNRAQIGHPYYELGPLIRWTFAGDRQLTSAFLAAAKLRQPQDQPFAKLALCYVLLHDADQLGGLPLLGQVSSLDELANRLFASPRNDD